MQMWILKGLLTSWKWAGSNMGEKMEVTVYVY